MHDVESDDNGLSRRHDGSLITDVIYEGKDQSWSHKSVRTRHIGLQEVDVLVWPTLCRLTLPYTLFSA